jgi:hypothetical protein
MDEAGFKFIDASIAGTSLMHVDGAGKVVASGVDVSGSLEGLDLQINGRATFKGATVIAGPHIYTDACASFIRIVSDGIAAANLLTLPGDGPCAPQQGQLLIVYNGDGEGTTGGAEIAPGRSVLFVFAQEAGPGWVPLTTVDARSSHLEGIASFTASSNLDIGPFSFKAQQLVAAGQSKGHVATYGAGGLLIGDAGLTFTDGLLSTPKLSVKQVMHTSPVACSVINLLLFLD